MFTAQHVIAQACPAPQCIHSPSIEKNILGTSVLRWFKCLVGKTERIQHCSTDKEYSLLSESYCCLTSACKKW